MIILININNHLTKIYKDLTMTIRELIIGKDGSQKMSSQLMII